MGRVAFFSLVCLVAVVPTFPAHAYIDPGMGSMLLQVLIGAIAASVFVLRRYWSLIVARVRSLLGK